MEVPEAEDEAALKKRYRNGQKAILNFPNREADSHASYAHSAELLASGEDRPFKRICDLQSSPGSISTLPSHEEGQNHPPSLEQPQKEHRNVGNPVSLQEQTKGTQEPHGASQCVDGSLSGLDEENVAQPDSSSQPSEEAFHQTPSQDYVLSSSWSDLSALNSYVERDRAISSMIAALNETIQRSLTNRAPCRTEFPHAKTTVPDVVEGECSDAERNAADSAIPRTVSPVLEVHRDPSLQAGSGQANWFQTRAIQDGRSVDHDGSKMMVKVLYKDGIIIKFELSLSSTKQELEEKVATRLKLSIGSFDVRYEDKEKDWILVACDEDLRTCMSTSTSLGNDTIKMMVVVCN